MKTLKNKLSKIISVWKHKYHATLLLSSGAKVELIDAF